MVINQNKMRELYGAQNADYTDKMVIELIKNRVKRLTEYSNYTNWQWVYIRDIQDMLDAIEF